MNQADYFYYSGHGRHSDGCLTGLVGGPGLTPALVTPYWNRDLDCVIFAGCSVLDVNDYNDNHDGPDHTTSPGKAWEVAGPSVLLGYNHYAPGDKGGAPARIMQSWLANRATYGDVGAWMKANVDNRAWNVCAIVKGQKYIYIKSQLKGIFKTQVEIPKENW